MGEVDVRLQTGWIKSTFYPINQSQHSQGQLDILFSLMKSVMIVIQLPIIYEVHTIYNLLPNI